MEVRIHYKKRKNDKSLLWNKVFTILSIILIILMVAMLILLAFNNLFQRKHPIAFASELILSFGMTLFSCVVKPGFGIIRFDNSSLVTAMIIAIMAYIVLLYIVYLHTTTVLGHQIVKVSPEQNDTSQMIQDWLTKPSKNSWQRWFKK